MARAEIDRLFFAAERQYPEAPALDAGPRQRTYRELGADVRRLSAWLQTQAEPGERVAVLTADPWWAIPALLATLDAGLTYAPVDPAWPYARIAAVAAPLQPRVLLLDPELAGEPEGRHHALGVESLRTVVLDRLSELVAPPWVSSRTAPGPTTLFHTSGSTGVPKGILGRPGAIAHYIEWEAGLLRAAPGLRVSALASCSFDASLRDAGLPLSVGGVVCIPPDCGILADGPRLLTWLRSARVQVLHCVPTVFRGLLAALPDPSQLPALQAVLLAGEPLRPSDAARCFACFGDRVALYNLYGPTETTMTRLVHRVTPADAQASNVPLGRPMADTEVFIVDSAGRPRPPERPGEIVLRTPFAALGYLGQPEATARVFVMNLLSDGSPIPVYRTGDLGVQRADGLIEFRGRRDLQVKLRGVRIELEEVEAAVCAVPAVRAAVAALRDGPDGEPRLCVWVVGEEPGVVGQVRRHLVATLPPALLPSRIVQVEALPRLLNGKVDRAALSLGEAPPRSAGDAVQGPVETRIAEVLGEILRCEIGASDDFFALGGDSLQALRAIWRLNEVLGVALPIDALYHAPTVRALAVRSAVATPQTPDNPFTVVQLAGGTGRPVYWLPPSYGLLLACRPLAAQLSARRPIVGLEIATPTGATVEELAAAAARRIRAHAPAGPWTLVGWSFGGVLAFELARQLDPTGGAIDRLILLDSAAPGDPFDFTAGDAATAALAARLLGHMAGRPLALDEESLRGKSPEWLVGRILEVATENGIPIPPEVRPHLAKIVQVREASMAAWRCYQPGPWPGAALVVRASAAERDWTAGWSTLLSGPVERRVVSGAHVSMLGEPHVGALSAVLDQALGAHGPESPSSSASTE